MNENNTGRKVFVSVIIVILAAFLINGILGPEENWGATYEDLGRTVTSFIVMGIGGILLWFLWRKKKSQS